MVLNELGSTIAKALASINSAETIDDKLLDACLKDICTALLQADINVKLVMNLRCEATFVGFCSVQAGEVSATTPLLHLRSRGPADEQSCGVAWFAAHCAAWLAGPM